MTATTFFFFSSRRRHTRCLSDWSSDVCSSDLLLAVQLENSGIRHRLDKQIRQSPDERVDSIRRITRCGASRRSEERRVGKEGRTRGGPRDEKRKTEARSSAESTV